MTPAKSTSRAKRVIGIFPELSGVGGVQEAGRLTAMALHCVACERQWPSHFLSLNDAPETHILKSGTKEIHFRGFGRSKVKFAMEGLRQARGKECIIVAAHPNLALPAAVMQKVSVKARTIVMAHGIEIWKPLSTLRRWAVGQADAVTGPSRDTVGKLADVQRVPSPKIRLLPWPLNPSFLGMAASAADLQLPTNFPTGRVVLTVGRWSASERYKGADDLIRAVVALQGAISNISLALVGTGDDLPRLRQLAADLRVGSRVHFFEGLSREQLAACYAHADVFALPSRAEGFGLVFLEAMAFSKPLVGVASGGATDLITNGANGFLVASGNTAQLTAALEKLLSSSALCGEMGRRGAHMVRERYAFSAFQCSLRRILADCGLDDGCASIAGCGSV